MTLTTPEAGISGLFAFPEGDSLILVLNVRPGLTLDPPYDLEPYTYAIHLDLSSEVTFDVASELARYGGTVSEPSEIEENVSLRFKLKNDATLGERQLDGLSSEAGIEVFVGVRDDPFIFPAFFGTNVVAIVVSLPFASLPGDPKNLLIWATTHHGARQIDHVGRSNRTMQPRFGFLNTLHPSEHVAALRQQKDHPGLVTDILSNVIMPLYELRPYDFFPDVMIFSRERAAGFPNGRRLSDDVAALTCAQGDCLLWEVGYIDSPQWPRATENDKPFLAVMPYLAEPWPSKPAPHKHSITAGHKILLVSVAVLFFVLLALPWGLLIYVWRKR